MLCGGPVAGGFHEAGELAAEHPEKLAELQRLFLIQAARFNVLPMDVRSAERFNGELVGRPELVKGDSQTFYAGMKRMSENSVVNVKNKSFTVTARIVIPEGGADGVLIAQGGAYGGWSVYLTSGALAFAYNLGGVETEYTRSEAPLTPGEHEVRMHFAYDGGGLGKGGGVTLFDGDDQVATGRVTRTLPFFFSMDETVDIGSDLATPVSGDYGPTGNEFTGTIVWLRIDLGDDDHTHLADPEHVEFDALWRRSVIARCRRQGTVLACPRNHAALPTL